MTGSTNRSTPRHRPKMLRAPSRTTVPEIMLLGVAAEARAPRVAPLPSAFVGYSCGHQVGEDALERLVGRGDLVQPHAVLAGQPWEHLAEPPEVGGLDLDATLGPQTRSADRRVA